MKKYAEASGRMAASTCMSAGITPLRDSVSAVKSEPMHSTASTDCIAARRAFWVSPAPSARAMKARKPTLSAESELLTSQLTVLVEPTAAVALVPSAPTIAVSIYCTAVCMSCSSMVGHASVQIMGSMDGSGFLRRMADTSLRRMIASYCSRKPAGRQDGTQTGA